MMQRILFCCFAAGLVVAAQAAGAENTFPSKPVRIVAPYAAGGPVDVVARVVGKQLSQQWGQVVIVENRAGAGGNIGTAYVAKAPPDGYTLLVNTPAMLITPLIGPEVGFDAIKDFTPIARVGLVPALLVTNTSVPAKNVEQLIALAKAKPGQLNYASPGVGTSLQFASVLFGSMAKVKLTHVPYKGGSQALPQLVAGETQMMFDPIGEALPLVRAGKLNAIAISTTHRSPLLPNVPTVAESGLPGYDFSVWYAVFAPAGISPELRRKIGADVVQAVQQSDAVATLQKLGIELQVQGPEEFERHYRDEQNIWKNLVAAEHIVAQ